MTSETFDDRYELGTLLGAGGMARVHLATDRILGRTVAIKILDPRFERDEEFVERFRREARAAAALSHPNVVAVYDTGEERGRHYIVMEHVDGRTLADLLAEEAPLTPERAAAIGAEVCEGLAAAHDAGVVHRDVKPGNVLLTEDERVKVADFGIARALAADTLTRGDRVLGTVAYLAPEQAAGGPVDERADLYALGCVLHQMLSGSPPFTGDTPVAVAAKHMREEPPPLEAGVPASLAAVVERALAKDPADRYPDAPAMGAALRRAARGGDTRVLTEPVAPPPRRGLRRRWLLGAAAALMLLAAILGIGALLTGEPDPAPAGRAAAPPPDPEPSPSPEEEEPPTIQEAFAALTQTVGRAVAAGEMESDVGEEIVKKAREAVEKHREGKSEEVLKKMGEAREELAEGAEDGEASPSAVAEVDAALETLAQTLDGTPPPTLEDEDDDNPGKGRGKGKGGEKDD